MHGLMRKETVQPHIRCTKDDISPYVILPGDPGRARYIGKEFLRNGRIAAESREFVTYRGEYKEIPITVTSTGIGSPSTAIATEELINLGAKVLIRVGTCGGALKRDIPIGSLIIPLASIRDEGTTREYLPPEFPAVADYQVVKALENAAKKANFRYYVGINRTHDAFYGRTSSLKRWGGIYEEPRMKDWSYPLLSSEMEAAPLFLIALIRGVKAGAVLAVNANPEPLREITLGEIDFSAPATEADSIEAKRAEERAIITALEAMVQLAKGG